MVKSSEAYWYRGKKNKMTVLKLNYGNEYEAEEIEFKFDDNAIAIDCGANVGEVTDLFLEAGFKKIYAFEPNIYAYNVLEEKFRNNPNVACIPKGVTCSSKAGLTRLYLHEQASKDQVKFSTGCSTAADKNNVNENNFTVIEMVGISDFIKSLEEPVGLIKIDVEGTEADILNDLLDSGLAYEVDRIFVETHEEKVPSSREPMKLIRERIEKEGLEHIHLEWI